MKQRHIVSLSGGKNSAAMLFRLIEEGERVDEVVFADTTLEFPEMYKWIDEIEASISLPITRLKPAKSFDEWFYGIVTSGRSKGQRRGFPLTAFPCYWSREAKAVPLRRFCGVGNVVYIGIAPDEAQRAEAKRFKRRNEFKFPLIEWGMTSQECREYLTKRKLCPPLLMEFGRSGCWLCPKQSINSLRSLYHKYPELWTRLRRYEQESPHGFSHRHNLSQLELRFRKEVK